MHYASTTTYSIDANIIQVILSGTRRSQLFEQLAHAILADQQALRYSTERRVFHPGSVSHGHAVALHAAKQ
jgi:hypothetical protein